MPVIKSAKKKARQAIAHEERNKGTRTKIKTFMKKILDTSKTDVEAAKKLLPKAYSVLDTACKKHMLHPNTAARRKSRLARVIAAAGVTGSSAKKVTAKA
jgi:small subunit ribosomal protein S20